MKAQNIFKTLPAILFIFLAVNSVYAAEEPPKRTNPFELPKGVYSKDNIPKEEPKTLTLEAIFTIKTQKIATISGENYIEGDFIGGKRLTHIFKNRVTLDDAGKELSLVLESGEFRIRKQMHN